METEHGFRPDIQGLRAIAVVLVVVFHLYPSLLPGGYVGVDVFFVISGYLITAHLARTLRRGQRVRLLDFYGRRARRLLPAAALVLTVTAVGSWLWLPVTLKATAAEQIRASALYFQNWQLAHDATDYFTQDQPATPVEHFWSLSVEEQFYLVWPLLFLAAAGVGALAARRSRSRQDTQAVGQFAPAARITLFALTTAVVGASLVYSVVETSADPAAAYFVTPTRMWELGFGGLLALAPERLSLRLRRAGPLAWLGLVAIVGSAFVLSGASPFPGWIALVPVAGAAAMILCGSHDARFGTARLTASAPAVFVGDISYELYLWHWPIIVLWGAYSQSLSIGFLDGPIIIIVSVTAAWLTKLLLTDPVRRAPIVLHRPTASLATAVTVAVPALLVTGFLANGVTPWDGQLGAAYPGAQAFAHAEASDPRPGDEAASAAVQDQNTAAQSDTSPDHQSATSASAPLVPPLNQVRKDVTLLNNSACQVDPLDARPTPCTVHDPLRPTLTVAMVGDSHMSQWSSSLLTIAKQRKWKLIGEVHSSCPWTSVMKTRYGKPYKACHTWGAQVLDQLLHTIKPDVVVVSDRPTTKHPHADAAMRIRTGEGMVPYFKELLQHGIKVVAIHETPEPGRNIPNCLATNQESIRRCSTIASRAIQKHTPIDAARAKLGHLLPVVNMNDLLCTPTVCPPAVGNVIVYRDTSHLTKTMTRTLTPYLEERLIATGAFTRGG